MLITDRNQINNKQILCLTSIGGSPITIGHTRLLQDCKKNVMENLKDKIRITDEDIQLLVVVNSDDFLLRKHGLAAQSEDERAEIIDSIKGVNFVYIHHSHTQDIADCIHYFQPHFFCKGGDRSEISNIPESERLAMQDYGVVFIGGVGGREKVSSSSDIMKKIANHYFYNKPYGEWLENRPKYEYKCLDWMKNNDTKSLSKERDELIFYLDRVTYPE